MYWKTVVKLCGVRVSHRTGVNSANVPPVFADSLRINRKTGFPGADWMALRYIQVIMIGLVDGAKTRRSERVASFEPGKNWVDTVKRLNWASSREVFILGIYRHAETEKAQMFSAVKTG